MALSLGLSWRQEVMMAVNLILHLKGLTAQKTQKVNVETWGVNLIHAATEEIFLLDLQRSILSCYGFK